VSAQNYSKWRCESSPDVGVTGSDGKSDGHGGVVLMQDIALLTEPSAAVKVGILEQAVS